MRARTTLRQMLLGLADRVVPAHVALYETSIGMYRTHLIGTIAELGVADELRNGPATADQLAARLDVHADTLHRLLRSAAAEGITRLDRTGRFSLSRTGATLRRDDPHTLQDWARYFSLKSTAAAWADLNESVRTGESAFSRVHGTSSWSWYGQHPEEERTFAGAMRWRTEQVAPLIVGGYPWPEQGTICDVAGGVGTLLAAILKRRPRARGVIVDAPGVLAAADEYLRTDGVRERVELVEGDIFERVDATADVYVMKNVLHDWDDERCRRILRTARTAMAAGSRLVLVEFLQERNRPNPSTARLDLHMLTQCDGGRERSADELKQLLSSATLRPGIVRETAGPALIEAVA
jgi:ubiquinone/menaquinone biosynthesis C-methylase UbiE